ncbi:Bifunctional protein GlmU [Candidatus Gugararchaeum adminiculabundum]|nr:Bifunctional protein GlmU [Candidatus Gugararchaeum adminiculabundum]
MSIKKAIVLAAGEGKRLRPLTYTRPKCMIQLAGKPILQHVLESLQVAGVSEASVVIKYMKETITEHFKQHPIEGLKLNFIEQGEKYGTAAAFLEGEKFIDDTFIGIAGDVITEASAIRRLIDAHESAQGAEMTAALKRVTDPQNYGVVSLDSKGFISKFTEKPKSPVGDLANTSIYVFEPKIFSKMKAAKKSPRGEFEMTDVIQSSKVKGVVIDEYWLDMGLPWQLFDANDFLLSKMKAKVGDIDDSKIMGKVIMEKNARIFDSYIEGPLYVGENSIIGPHAYIRGITSIGKNCSIGDSTTIKNSIIFDNVNAKHLTYIGDSVIGSNCNFGAGTQIANYRFDAGSIKATVNEVIVDTKRNKLGTIIGDNTKTGVLSSIMPGKTIGDDCWIGANVMIEQDVPRKTRVFLKQDLTFEKRE